jgi:amidase
MGPLARRVGDLRLALAAMAAYDLRDPWWVPAPLAGAALSIPIRVALLETAPSPGLHPGIAAALKQAATWLEDAGYAVEQAAAPSIEEAAALWSRLVLNEAKLGMISQINQHGGAAIRKVAALMIERAPPTDFQDFWKALGGRAGLVRQWQLFLEHYPLILMPVCREPAFPLGLDQQDAAAMTRIFNAVAPILAPAVVGLPCVAVPTGVSDDGPLGVQLVADRFREDLCLDAAEAIEKRAGLLTPIDPMS